MPYWVYVLQSEITGQYYIGQGGIAGESAWGEDAIQGGRGAGGL
jgi:hypothetical protein